MSTLDKRGEALRRKLGLIPNLLIVDGDDDARERLAVVARAEGYLVHQTVDAPNALRALEVGGISVLAAELQLDGPTDGLELLRTARAGWPLLPLIAMSSDLAPFPGVLPPGTMFVSKPFRARRLGDLLRAAGLQSGQGG